MSAGKPMTIETFSECNNLSPTEEEAGNNHIEPTNTKTSPFRLILCCSMTPPSKEEDDHNKALRRRIRTIPFVPNRPKLANDEENKGELSRTDVIKDRDLVLVVQQSGKSPKTCRKYLEKHNGDIVNAIMDLND